MTVHNPYEKVEGSCSALSIAYEDAPTGTSMKHGETSP
jgi:hypothetical protein